MRTFGRSSGAASLSQFTINYPDENLNLGIRWLFPGLVQAVVMFKGLRLKAGLDCGVAMGDISAVTGELWELLCITSNRGHKSVSYTHLTLPTIYSV